MLPIGTLEAVPTTSTRWWKERELFLILLIVAGAHLIRTGVLTVRGEEPRWTQVAAEMALSGDWITPREQGELFQSRPPFHSWMLAGSVSLFGSNSAWVIRFPSVMSILLLCCIIYGYTRQYLSRTGAFASAVAFATMGETFTIGQLGETDAMFVLFVSGSILLWHWGILANWHPFITWSSGYAFTAFAFLCKGSPQPVVYFCGSVGLFIVYTRRWRSLFSFSHLFGIQIGLAIVAAWAVPYALMHGWQNMRATCISDTAMHMKVFNWPKFLMHTARFPFEVGGGTLPWSLLLLPFLRRDFRRWVRENLPQTLMPALATLLIFPTCWLPPDGQTRYVAPMYPFMAILAGVAVEAAACQIIASKMSLRWPLYLHVVGSVMLIFATSLLITNAFIRNTAAHKYSLPFLSSLAYSVVLTALAVVAFRYSRGGEPRRSQIMLIGLFMIVSITGIMTDLREQRSQNAPAAIAELRQKLPANQPLVSLGHVDALFRYYHGEFIAARPWPFVAPGEYFCCNCAADQPLSLPFAWQQIGSIPLDREKMDRPERIVVVGVRLPLTTELPAANTLTAAK